MNYDDLEGTTPETRKRHAGLWQEDWYKLLEDMHHCAQFIMRDEIADLLSDGLIILGEKLTAAERQEWERIIDAVKSVVIDSSASMAKSIHDFPKIQNALMAHCGDMVHLLERIDRLSP
jgi:hypothetical protein